MTRRAWTFLIVALLLYFLANQTQVGWLYLMSNALVGLLGIAWLYSWGMLRPLQGARHVQPAAGGGEGEDGVFHEENAVEVALELRNPAARAMVSVRGREPCPFAPPDEQAQLFFLPRLFRGEAATLRYQTTCDRRGVHRFGPVILESAGPFGLFRTRHWLAMPTEVLVYPFFYPFKRLRSLESHKFPQRQVPRVGVGGEVIGTRDYRPGDAPRTVHWRSSARAARLVVKEFADEEQPALTVALDLSAAGNVGQGKRSTFETAIRIAASLGYYATQRGIPFQLVAASPKWRPPRTPLSWWATLSYLAKVENDGEEPLERLLHQVAGVPLLVALVSRSDEATIRALHALHRRGTRTLALFITLDGSLPLEAHHLHASGLDVLAVSPTNWIESLEQGPRGNVQGERG